MAAVLWSTYRTDVISVAKQQRFVAHALETSVDKIPYDQESVAIWDDAIKNVRTEFNLKWVEHNLSTWMFDYFKHDQAMVLDDRDQLLYLKTADETVDEPVWDAELAGLVKDLRRQIAAGALDDYEAGRARIPRSVDRVVLGNRPAIASVMPIVTDTGKMPQERGKEFLLVSVRFLDTTFVENLSSDYQLAGARFSRSAIINPPERSFALENAAGQTIGYFVWRPFLPGSVIFWEVAPVIAFGLVCIGSAVVLLIRGLRSSYAQLIASGAAASHAASHDVLTALPNRAYFDRQLMSALSARQDGPQPLALLFLDLDRFKTVNDTLGHAAGDELIKQFVLRIGQMLAPENFLARTGGDEFAIIVPDATDQCTIEELCADILTLVAAPFDVRGTHAVVGVSIGIAMARVDHVAPADLARQADIALYQAKGTGRNCFCFFTKDVEDRLRAHAVLEADLRAALGEGGLELAYQPIYNSATLRVAGIEALARWNHPRLGSVSPQIFIAIAEQTGLIHELGHWVLREACGAICDTDFATLAVNVSPVQILKPGFADTLLSTLTETGFPPGRLEIEITEGTLLDTTGVAEKVLQTLRSAGIKIALDDFGTGYSSLSYLMKHQVDRLKIDRSFVSQLGEGSSASSVVRAIVTMAQAIGVSVTAEGVETRDQQAILQQLGCDQLQGHLLSKPVPVVKLLELGDERVASPVAA
ncbi:MAG: bifunctional diguanylate cyclase/phosphodiesterase [Hyphomicrobiaceae bacterium]|nr:bifunctional diguanylate cyclase/phosphodiesterase [Hyphomicrobiaceae bacterium]